MSDRRTTRVTDNVERFKNRKTTLHQCCCQQKIFLTKQPESEFLEVDTTWWGQQSAGDGFHPSLHEEIKGPSKYRWVQGSDHVGTIVIVPMVGDHGQVLEGGGGE